MLKLTEIYRRVLEESEAENQARKALEGTFDNVDEVVEKIKRVAPENRYIIPLARFASEIGSDTEEMLKAVANGLQWFKKQYDASLEYSSKSGLDEPFHFNKTMKEYDVEAEEKLDAKEVYGLCYDALEHKEQYQMLNQSKKMGKDDDKTTPKVDGKPTNRVYKGENVEIYAGDGQRACVEHSKETDWCIGEPKSGHYAERRAEGSTFYFVYDQTQEEMGFGEGADKVVIEVVDDEFEVEYNVYDKRNEKNHVKLDDKEITDPYDYFDHLKDVEPDLEPEKLLDPIPKSNEEEVQNKINHEPLENLVGRYMKMDDGTIVDLTLQWIKQNTIDDEAYWMIKKHPVGKKFFKDYIWTAIVNHSFEFERFRSLEDDIGSKWFDKYLNKMRNDHGDDTEVIISNMPDWYFLYVSQDEFEDFFEKHLDGNKFNHIPGFIITRRKDISEDLLKRHINKKFKLGVIPGSSELRQLSSENILQIISEMSEKIKDEKDERAMTTKYDDLLELIGKLALDDVDTDDMSKKVANDILSEGLYRLSIYKRPAFRSVLSDEQIRKYVEKILEKGDAILTSQQMKRFGFVNYGVELTVDQAIRYAMKVTLMGDTEMNEENIKKVVTEVNSYKDLGLIDQDTYDKVLEKLDKMHKEQG